MSNTIEVHKNRSHTARYRVSARFHYNKKITYLLVVYVTLQLAQMPTNQNFRILRDHALPLRDTFDNFSVKDKAKLC